MNKCKVPKKKIIVLSNNKFSQDIMIVYEKTENWSFEWQGMTASGNKWQWVAANDSGTKNENDTVPFKEWVTAFFLWQKLMHYSQILMDVIRVFK